VAQIDTMTEEEHDIAEKLLHELWETGQYYFGGNIKESLIEDHSYHNHKHDETRKELVTRVYHKLVDMGYIKETEKLDYNGKVRCRLGDNVGFDTVMIVSR
jgi:hypothetical protein